MNYGMYLAASGVLTNLYRQDVIANNLANANTVGFKPDMVFSRARLPERLEGPVPTADPQWLLEQLGGGTLLAPTMISNDQGHLEQTGGPLDVAIKGEGFFLVEGNKADGTESFQLTRDGRFTMNNNGELVMATTGRQVLDVNHQPITLNPTKSVQINSDGAIMQDGALVSQLQLVVPAAPAALQKVGNNLLKLAGDDKGLLQPATGSINQGFIETSAVDSIMALNAMIGATKSAQSSARMMQYHDQVMEQAIGTFGRVA